MPSYQTAISTEARRWPDEKLRDWIERFCRENNLHADKESTSANNAKLVPPGTIQSDYSASTREPKSIVKVTQQDTVVDSNSSGRDPNSTPTAKPKSRIEELAELGDTWLEKSPDE